MLTAKRKKEIDLIIKKHLEGKLDADDIDDKLINDEEWKYFDLKCGSISSYIFLILFWICDADFS